MLKVTVVIQRCDEHRAYPYDDYEKFNLFNNHHCTSSTDFHFDIFDFPLFNKYSETNCLDYFF